MPYRAPCCPAARHQPTDGWWRHSAPPAAAGADSLHVQPSSHHVRGRRQCILQNEYLSLISMGPTHKPVAWSNNGYSSKKFGGRYDICQKILLFLKASLSLKCFIRFIYCFHVFSRSLLRQLRHVVTPGFGGHKLGAAESGRWECGSSNACTGQGTSS